MRREYRHARGRERLAASQHIYRDGHSRTEDNPHQESAPEAERHQRRGERYADHSHQCRGTGEVAEGHRNTRPLFHQPSRVQANKQDEQPNAHADSSLEGQRNGVYYRSAKASEDEPGNHDPLQGDDAHSRGPRQLQPGDKLEGDHGVQAHA